MDAIRKLCRLWFLVCLGLVFPGLARGEPCTYSDDALLSDSRRLSGYRIVTAPEFVDAGASWSLNDLVFALYLDEGNRILLNNYQLDKLPALETCGVRLHEMVHHLQYLAGVRDREQLQAREVEAYEAQQAWLREHESEYRTAMHDGIFAVMHFKRMQKYLARDNTPSDLAGLAADCHGWNARPNLPVTICEMH